MAQLLKALGFSFHMVTYNHTTPVPMPSDLVPVHTCRQSTHTNKFEKKKKLYIVSLVK